MTGARGATLTAGAGTFVTAGGQAISGQVQVHLTPLDPALAQELAAYPGSLVGVTGGVPQGLLASQGVLDVTVEQNGQALQLASGKTITVNIPGTALGQLPAQSDLWSFDSSSGYWQHEGTATLSGGVYTATLPHLSYWNVDQVIGGGQAACLQGTVINNGLQVAAWVEPSPIGFQLVSESIGYSGLNSDYCFWIKPDAEVLVTAKYNDDQVGSVRFHTGSGERYVFDCHNAVNCQTVPPIVIGQSADLDAGTPSCTGASADGGTPGPSADGGTSDPFAGTGACGADLMTFFACFDASGGCALSGTSTVTIAFDSGASLQLVPNGSTATLSFYGPGHKFCGQGYSSSRTGDLDLTPSGSGTYVMSQNAVECPDGTIIHLSAAQQSAIGGCQALGLGLAGLASCTIATGTCLGYPMAFVASCSDLDTTCGDECLEYTGGWTCKLQAACSNGGYPSPVWSAQRCSTNSLVGYCVAGCEAGSASEIVSYQYTDLCGLTAADLQTDCENGGGTWLNP